MTCTSLLFTRLCLYFLGNIFFSCVYTSGGWWFISWGRCLLTRVGFISTVFATSYRFESVWLHFFFQDFNFNSIFFFVYPSVSTFGKHYNFLVSISISPFSLSEKHFPHFCLRISLMCVGGCLVCVLIFFSIYYIFFFSLSSS